MPPRPARRRARSRRRRPALRGHVLPRTPTTGTSTRSRARGAGSATRSWSSAVTASGTATCTPTTSAPPSRRASSPAVPPTSASPTCSSRWRSSKRPTGCGRTAAARRPRPVAHVTTGVVAVAVGDGLRTLLGSLGVQQVVAGGQSMNPSTAQILEAVEQCAADGVIVLPNNKNIVPVAAPGARAHRAARSTSCRRRRWSRRSAALVVYDPDAVARRERGRDGRRRRHASRRARSRRRCATASPSAARSRPATGSRSRVTASASRPKSAADAAIAHARRARRRRRRARHASSSAPRPIPRTPRGSRRISTGAHPDVEVELHERWPAALPVPRRRRVARASRLRAERQPGLTLRELASHRPVAELQGGRRQARGGARRDGHHDGARPVASTTPAATSTAPSVRRSPSSRSATRRPSTPRCVRCGRAERATASARS